MSAAEPPAGATASAPALPAPPETPPGEPGTDERGQLEERRRDAYRVG